MELATLSWGKRIKSFRDRYRLTQADLARVLECSVNMISTWEQREARPWSEQAEGFLRIEKMADESSSFQTALHKTSSWLRGNRRSSAMLEKPPA